MKEKAKLVRLATVFLACGLGLAAFFAERLNNERHAAASRAAVQEAQGSIRSRLEGNLYGSTQLVKGMSGLITLDPHLTQAKFERAVRPLFLGRSYLRNIGAAPDMAIRFIYPVADNEQAVGLDFRRTPGQFETAERARLTRQIVLAGPMELVQGGVGLAMRMPVFFQRENGRERFWGLVSAVIDLEAMYRESGLLAADLPIEIAIRGKDASGPQGEVFFGRAGVFDEHPVLTDILLPHGSWQMAATPRGGWPTQADNAWAMRGGFLLVALLVLGPFFALGWAIRATAVARAQANASLTESQKLVQMQGDILESMPDAVVISDETGIVTLANNRTLTLSGYRREELLGAPLEILLPKHLRGSHTRRSGVMTQSRVRETGARMEFSALTKEGREIPVDISLCAVHTSSGVRVVTVLRDISDRKQAEAALAQAKKKADAASRAKSDFIASMSHELRTPLNAVIGFAQLLDMGVPASLAEAQKEAVGHILTSGRHLLKLVNEVLDLARIEAGRLDLTIETVPLAPLIEDVVALSQPAAAERGIVIRHSCGAGLLATADRFRVRQILTNLLSNAVKYNRPNGAVAIVCQAEENILRMTVADTGMGISEARRPEVFQPFQRLGAEQTAVEGAGIGLVICKQLAEAMNGRIGFESEVGVGSRFWVELPLAHSLRQAQLENSAPSAEADYAEKLGGRVL